MHAILAMLFAAQLIQVGSEYPIVEPRIGRASGAKFFGGAASDGDRFLVSWTRNGIATIDIGGVQKQLSTFPLSKLYLRGAIWSGASYVILAESDYDAYALIRLDRDGELLALPTMRQFNFSPRFAALVSNGDGFIVYAQDDHDFVARRYDRNGIELRETRVTNARVWTAASSDSGDYFFITGPELITLHGDGSVERRAIGASAASMSAASNGTSVFLASKQDVVIVPLDAKKPIARRTIDNDETTAAMFDGQAYELFFRENEHITLRRYAEDGTLLDASVVASAAGEYTLPLAAIRSRVALTLVWDEDNDYTNDIRVRTVAFPAAFAAPGDGVLVTKDVVEQSYPSLGSDGTTAIAAWMESPYPSDVVATVFNDAAAKHPTIDVSRAVSPDISQEGVLAVSTPGLHFVIWRELRSDRVRVLMSRISSDGVLIDRIPNVVVSEARTASSVSDAKAATSGRDLFVTWRNGNDLRAVRVTLDGDAGEPIDIARGGSESRTLLRVAWNGTAYVVFWSESTSLKSAVINNRGQVRPNGTVATIPKFGTRMAQTSTGFAAFWSDLFGSKMFAQKLDNLGRASGSVETLLERHFPDPIISDIDLTTDGSLGVFTELGARITANVFDRDLHLMSTTIVCESIVASTLENLIVPLQNARVVTASGRTFAVYMRYVVPEAHSRIFVRDITPASASRTWR